VADQAVLSFGGLLRQLRTEARLTQEELAEAAHLSTRSVSDLERGINRTARKDTAELLAGALGLAGPARESFVAAARGRGPAEDVLAAREGSPPGPRHGGAQSMRGCPYRRLLPFTESDAEVFYGRERLAAEVAAKLAVRAAGGAAVGSRHRPPGRRAPPRQRPDRRGHGGVQPRWQAVGQRLRRRRHGAAVEPGHRPARRRAPPRQRPVWRVRGGVQSVGLP
jgi:transcriptional regulator with XRE-family HTH domain